MTKYSENNCRFIEDGIPVDLSDFEEEHRLFNATDCPDEVDSNADKIVRTPKKIANNIFIILL